MEPELLNKRNLYIFEMEELPWKNHVCDAQNKM